MALYAGRLQKATVRALVEKVRGKLLNWTDSTGNSRKVFERLLAGQCLSSKRGQIVRTFLMVTNIQKRIYLSGLHKQNVRLALAQQSGHCASRRLAPIAVGI
ncbi:hypothetical protein T10_5697 [Trichinella papuae]|uniref:Uncharacterized protein n=1 Tax=Trichinella papuae TaxID=268474 RepID=A0A0V1MMK5_9BILA|nr:hypothetical protein T10_5697 [Trichinella papuae]